MQEEVTHIFVFGSNLAGRHGAGAALFARKNRGAVYGQARGLQGQSYAIPTLDENLKQRDLSSIAADVKDFLAFAVMHPKMRFQVTPIGCGLAGFKPKQIAPMFDYAPENCELPVEFDGLVKGEAVRNPKW